MLTPDGKQNDWICRVNSYSYKSKFIIWSTLFFFLIMPFLSPCLSVSLTADLVLVCVTELSQWEWGATWQSAPFQWNAPQVPACSTGSFLHHTLTQWHPVYTSTVGGSELALCGSASTSLSVNSAPPGSLALILVSYFLCSPLEAASSFFPPVRQIVV